MESDKVEVVKLQCSHNLDEYLGIDHPKQIKASVRRHPGQDETERDYPKFSY